MESSRSEMRSLEERYHALFAGNIAAAILATPEGTIVDCNDAFVRTFGFNSRTDVLSRTAWDFYFHRSDREAFISPFRVVENYGGEEGVFRHSSGAPIHLMYTRIVASHIGEQPELVLSTSVDITEQKRLEKRVRQLSKNILTLPHQAPSDAASSFTSFSPIEPELVKVSEELGALLRRINESLRPTKLRLIGKPESQDFVLAVERMKVLVEQIEALRLTSDPSDTP
jgi:PAS domain S-box-containing protein